MDNGMNTGLNASDIILGSALAGRGGYGGGGAWGGGYYGGYAPFAGPASNAVRLDRNAQQIENQADCTREVLGRENAWTRSSFEDLTRQNQFNRLCDRLVDQEFRTADRLRDIEREINTNARAAADCCCETQKEILRLDAANNLKFAELSKQQAVDNGAVTARLAAIDAKIDANQRYNELFAENQALKTQVACGCVTGCSTPCNG